MFLSAGTGSGWTRLLKSAGVRSYRFINTPALLVFLSPGGKGTSDGFESDGGNVPVLCFLKSPRLAAVGRGNPGQQGWWAGSGRPRLFWWSRQKEKKSAESMEQIGVSEEGVPRSPPPAPSDSC